MEYNHTPSTVVPQSINKSSWIITNWRALSMMFVLIALS